MDWNNVVADETKLLTVHYTPGRTQKLRGIVLHHNAGNLSIQDCYNVWQSREASAHYQVDINGRIGQLVNDDDTAWHAGSANPWSIGIEHANNQFGPWTISDATLEAGAHLVAALCKYYGFGRPEWMVNVFPHSYFMATACPGEIAGSQNAAYMSRAQEWYDAMVNGTDAGDAPSGTDQNAPIPAPEPVQPEGSDGFQGGTYVCNVDTLNVRNAPSLSGAVVAQYTYGQTVNLDSWYTVADGYVWGRYTAYSGAIRYVAVGPHTGSPEPNDYLVLQGSAPSGSGTSSAVPNGTYTCVADVLNVRDAPSTSGAVVAQYSYGQTVYLDNWSTSADGYIWGRYTAYSGATRYVAVRTVSGEAYLTL